MINIDNTCQPIHQNRGMSFHIYCRLPDCYRRFVYATCAAVRGVRIRIKRGKQPENMYLHKIEDGFLFVNRGYSKRMLGEKWALDPRKSDWRNERQGKHFCTASEHFGTAMQDLWTEEQVSSTVVERRVTLSSKKSAWYTLESDVVVQMNQSRTIATFLAPPNTSTSTAGELKIRP